MKDAALKALSLFSCLRDLSGQAKALHMKAMAYSSSGDTGSAVRNAQKALAIYKEIGDAQGQLFELTAIAQLQLRQGQPYAALHAASLAYSMASKTDMSAYATGSFEAFALYLVCQSLVESGRAKQAVEKAQIGLKRLKSSDAAVAGYCVLLYSQLSSNPDDALDTVKEARQFASDSNPDTKLDLLYMTAYAQIKNKMHEEAAKTLRQAVNEYGSVGQHSNLKGPEAEALRMVSFALSSIEGLDQDQSILDEALEAAQEAKDFFKNDGLKSDEASALILMTVLKTLKPNDNTDFVSMLKEAHELYSEADDVAGEGIALNLLTDLHVGSEQNNEALGYANDSVELWAKAGMEEPHAEALQASANIFMAMKDYESAEEKILEAQDLGGLSKSLQATLSIMLAKIYFEEGMEDSAQEKEYKLKALKAAQTAVVLAGQSGKKNLWAVALSWQSQVLAWSARVDEALILAEKSEKGFAQTNDLKSQAMAMIKIAQLLKIMGKKKDAKEKAEEALSFAQENELAAAEKEAQSVIESMIEKKPVVRSAGGVRMVRKLVKKFRKKGGGGEGAVAKPAGLDLSATTGKVSKLVKDVLADDDDLSHDTPFMEAGVDSLGSVQLVTDVGKEFKMALAPSVVFDFPTVRALAEHLVAEVGAGGDAPATGGGGDDEWEEYEDWEDVEEAIEGEAMIEYAPVQAQAAPVAAASAAVEPVKKSLDPVMVHKKVLELVKNVLADDDDLATDMPFMEAGVDSLGSVQLVTDVGKAFSMALAPSVVFDFPTVRALADHLVEESANK